MDDPYDSGVDVNALEPYLRDATFPASAETLAAHARALGAPDGVLRALDDLPSERTYPAAALVYQDLLHGDPTSIEYSRRAGSME